MKRLIFIALCLLYALNAISQQPGSLVVTGARISLTGCLADLNDESSLKKAGLCKAMILAPAVELKDLTCDPHPSGKDTILDLTYSPTKTVTNPKDPNVKEGTLVLTPDLTRVNEDGCMQVNNVGNRPKCGFNVVLIGLSVPNLACSVKVSGGNTEITLTYPPVTR